MTRRLQNKHTNNTPIRNGHCDTDSALAGVCRDNALLGSLGAAAGGKKIGTTSLGVALDPCARECNPLQKVASGLFDPSKE
jgi:hypothetical protein